MNIDPFAIAALVVAILSAIFVAIKEGISLTLEYRESEATMKKKKEIDERLIASNLNQKISSFFLN